MVSRHLPFIGMFAAACLFASSAFALDQLPLPEPQLSPVSAEITQFASDAPQRPSAHCQQHLQKKSLTSEQKILSIKAYRACRSDEALQHLAVWRWQEASNQY